MWEPLHWHIVVEVDEEDDGGEECPSLGRDLLLDRLRVMRSAGEEIESMGLAVDRMDRGDLLQKTQSHCSCFVLDAVAVVADVVRGFESRQRDC